MLNCPFSESDAWISEIPDDAAIVASAFTATETLRAIAIWSIVFYNQQ